MHPELGLTARFLSKFSKTPALLVYIRFYVFMYIYVMIITLLLIVTRDSRVCDPFILSMDTSWREKKKKHAIL